MLRCVIFLFCTTSVAQVRVIPHVTPTGDFVTKIILMNLGGETEDYVLVPYASNGALALPLGYSPIRGSVQPGEKIEKRTIDFFGNFSASHFTIEASENLVVSIIQARELWAPQMRARRSHRDSAYRNENHCPP